MLKQKHGLTHWNTKPFLLAEPLSSRPPITTEKFLPASLIKIIFQEILTINGRGYEIKTWVKTKKNYSQKLSVHKHSNTII